jgi:DNA-binding Lrp family transcriptional regulator
VLDRLRGISQVREAYCITGPDDIIVVLEAPDAKSISDVVIAGLHDIEGVKGTDTRMVVDLP